MVRNGDMVAVFHSVHRVMEAEKILKSAGADILLIPVPRQLSSDCGLAIRYASTERALVASLLTDKGVRPAELYVREGEEFIQVPLEP